MSIHISGNIKKLRRSRDLTQEELAEIIGVSAQSVSKWERGDNFPDITMLPAIANFFEVSLDELVGMAAIRDEKRVEDAKARVRELEWEDNSVNYHDRVTEIWEELAREMPYNDEAQMLYAAHLAGLGGMGKPTEEVIALRRKAIKIFERILEKCTDDKTRYTIIANLSEHYGGLSELDKALEYANRLPDVWVSRQFYIEQAARLAIYKYGSDKGYSSTSLDDYKKTDRAIAEGLVKPFKDALLAYLPLVQNGLRNYRFWLKYLGLVDGEEYIRLIKLDIPFQQIFNLGNDLSNSLIYYDLAKEYAEMGETDKALDEFAKFVDGCKHYAEENTIKQISHTTDDEGNVIVYHPELSARETLLNQCENEAAFTPLRDNPRYIAEIERLKK
jgi:transcriptional regulator with XRE-family HTH domain